LSRLLLFIFFFMITFLPTAPLSTTTTTKNLDCPNLGRTYSAATDRAVERVVDSDSNTSMTTAHWNRVVNRASERQIEAVARGDRDWSDLSAGATRRVHEQAAAWRDIRTGVKPLIHTRFAW
jgi:hypothetical protein